MDIMVNEEEKNQFFKYVVEPLDAPQEESDKYYACFVDNLPNPKDVKEILESFKNYKSQF